MYKYKWFEMELCNSCHFKDKKNPDICHFKGSTVKPSAMMLPSDCSRYLRESKWKRMNDSNK